MDFRLGVSSEKATGENEGGFTRKLILAGFFIFMLLALAGWQLVTGLRHAEQANRNHQIETTFNTKKKAIESFFRIAYQTNRTLSLLPSIRSIKGGNRKSDNEDIIASKRFTVEGHQTVQQLYNNLAVNTGVSEVYAILEGLDASKGEVPFFMYDNLVIGSSKASSTLEIAGKANDDEPEESEAAEYAEYPNQIRLLKQRLPSYDEQSLDSIPALSSRPLRTCDNTQYLSKSHGDSLNAFGILYSVPFYNAQGEMRGVISAIYRTNVLEALLLGMPYLPLTRDDSLKAREESLAMPEATGRFWLLNRVTGLFIGDRREHDLTARLKDMAEGKGDPAVFHEERLDIRDQSPWSLVYAYDPVLIRNDQWEVWKGFWFQVFALVTVSVVIAFVLFDLEKRRRENAAKAPHEAAEVCKRNELIEILRKGIVTLSETTVKLDGMTQVLLDASQSTERRAQAVSASSEEISAMVQNISELADSIGSKSVEMGSSIRTQLTEVTGKVQEAMGTMDRMRAIEGASKAVAETTLTIQGITEQTHLLALNANIEASRAGEQGLGFNVVAGAVKQLARRTSEATLAISEKMQAVQQSSLWVGEAIKEFSIAESLIQSSRQNILDTLDQQTSSSEEVKLSLKEAAIGSANISSDIGEVANVTRQNAAIAIEARQSAQDLKRVATELEAMIAKL